MTTRELVHLENQAARIAEEFFRDLGSRGLLSETGITQNQAESMKKDWAKIVLEHTSPAVE